MEDKKVLYSYTVTRNSDGSVDVADNSEMFEGVDSITSDKIYEDVEAVAKLVALKRTSDAAFAAAYNGVAKFYQDIAAQQAVVKQEEN
jgi:hypothetical protein